ncbi:MAG: phosphoribosyl-ATP diphosphatase [Candidatus Hadarchaeia archaeon]
MTTEILEEVFEVIEDRKENPRKDSYVAYLLREGKEKIYEKIREETEELIEASDEEGFDEIVHESADVIFHVMVLLGAEDVGLEDVMEELRGRRKPSETE